MTIAATAALATGYGNYLRNIDSGLLIALAIALSTGAVVGYLTLRVCKFVVWGKHADAGKFEGRDG